MTIALTLVRDASVNGNSQFGTLYDDSSGLTGPAGLYVCRTLENNSEKIPPGEYSVTYYFSMRNRRRVPLLQNVPGRTYIEIHPANWWYQLDGCIAVGKGVDIVVDSLGVIDSDITFDALMQRLNGEPFTLTIQQPLA